MTHRCEWERKREYGMCRLKSMVVIVFISLEEAFIKWGKRGVVVLKIVIVIFLLLYNLASPIALIIAVL